MKRNFILAFAIACFLSTGLVAQDRDEGELKIDASENSTILSGKLTDIPLEEIIRATCEYQKIRVIYDPKKVQGRFSILAPREGIEIQKNAWFSLLQVALKQFRLTIVPIGQDTDQNIRVYEIIPSLEAITQCEVVVILDDIDSWTDTTERFVTLVVNLEYADANSVRGALQNLTTRNGGQVNPIAGINSLIIADYSSNIRRLAKIVKAMDVPPLAPHLEVIPVTHANAKSLANEINNLMQHRAQIIQSQPRRPGSPEDETQVGITAAPQGNALMVTGFDAGIAQIRELVVKLDVAATDTQGSKARLRHYPLKHARADVVAKALNEMLGNEKGDKKDEAVIASSSRTSIKYKELKPQARVAADKGSNSLLINSSHLEYTEILKMLEKIDVEAAASSGGGDSKSSGCAASGETSLLSALMLLLMLGAIRARRMKLSR
ncbi:secretin N-terminal domain-containing protein [Planctomycetota bacterium]|nr:secretin N-terminal domain-containing protein [Planctomycetota bacterium]